MYEDCLRSKFRGCNNFCTQQALVCLCSIAPWMTEECVIKKKFVWWKFSQLKESMRSWITRAAGSLTFSSHKTTASLSTVSCFERHVAVFPMLHRKQRHWRFCFSTWNTPIWHLFWERNVTHILCVESVLFAVLTCQRSGVIPCIQKANFRTYLTVGGIF